jgi:hypothetical protein
MILIDVFGCDLNLQVRCIETSLFNELIYFGFAIFCILAGYMIDFIETIKLVIRDIKRS